jgi:hypothetical protein
MLDGQEEIPGRCFFWKQFVGISVGLLTGYFGDGFSFW